MNNDYMNDEMEIDLIELLKHLLRNIKTILVVTLVCGLITFGVTQFILPKSYTSSTDITIMPQGELLDYTSYLNGNVVLQRVGSEMNIDVDTLLQNIVITRDESNPYNYNITIITNNPKLSCRVVKNVVKAFKKEMMSDLGLSSVAIVNEAQINTTPVSPDVKKNTLIGTLIGLVLSVLYFVLRFLFNKHFINDKEVEMFLGVDVLAEIPMEKQENFIVKNKASSNAYRRLRTNIEYNSKYPNVHSICLASANKGSGTTTIACNLAITFVANHSKVLLIDCNINKPTINKYFSIDNALGLSDMLLNQDYSNYYRYCTNFKDDHSNNLLYVMGTGRKVKNTLDLLSSRYFQEFMETMKDQFDFIVVDCPSIEDSNDVIPVGHIVDGTILVVSLPETEKNNAKKALQQLNRNGVNVIGTVLNKVE